MIKKLFALTLIFAFNTVLVLAQNKSPENNNYEEFCGINKETEKQLENSNERAIYNESRSRLEAFTKVFIEQNPSLLTNSKSGIDYTIPVVFHIIHAGGTENISNKQVEDCIRIMNEDFQRLNTSAETVHNSFTDIVADSKIELKLAKRDVDGNCTNGITRTFSDLTNDGGHAGRIGVVQENHGNWPGDRYMNVFVARDIGGAAGYTNYPNNNSWSGTTMGNGIHVLYNYVGSIEQGSSTGRNGTMSHEVGHWLNLMHTWGNSNEPELQSNCDMDDGVADTPNTTGWRFCNVNNESCGSLDNVENYMDYAGCRKMFTLGQKARMHAALNSSVGGRSTIVSEGNLDFTGVNEPDIVCRADFEPNANIICVGQEVVFTDMSFHGPTSWEWTFSGGDPSSSTANNPIVTYQTPGVYEVSLTVSDGQNSVSTTKNAIITVLEETAPLPFMEGFENNEVLVTSPWATMGGSENTSDFEIINDAAYSGQKSLKLTNYGLPVGTKNSLISSPIDLSEIEDEVTMSFRYAYRKRNTDNEEWLRIFLSNDCGENWALRRNIRGDQLSDIIVTTSWTPQSQDDWTTVHMTNITSQFWVENFMVRFELESDGGNNFYMDDINIYKGDESNDPTLDDEETSSLASHEKQNNFNIYPNPTTADFNISFSLKESKKVTIEIVDAIGKKIDTKIINGNLGNNLVIMDSDKYEKGGYFVKIQLNEVFVKPQQIVIQ